MLKTIIIIQVGFHQLDQVFVAAIPIAKVDFYFLFPLVGSFHFIGAVFLSWCKGSGGCFSSTFFTYIFPNHNEYDDNTHNPQEPFLSLCPFWLVCLLFHKV